MDAQDQDIKTARKSLFWLLVGFGLLWLARTLYFQYLANLPQDNIVLVILGRVFN